MMVRRWFLSWGPLCGPGFVFSVLRVTSGHRVKLAGRKNALIPLPGGLFC